MRVVDAQLEPDLQDVPFPLPNEGRVDVDWLRPVQLQKGVELLHKVWCAVPVSVLILCLCAVEQLLNPLCFCVSGSQSQQYQIAVRYIGRRLSALLLCQIGKVRQGDGWIGGAFYGYWITIVLMLLSVVLILVSVGG